VESRIKSSFTAANNYCVRVRLQAGDAHSRTPRHHRSRLKGATPIERAIARSVWRPPYLRRRISRICRIDTFSAGIGSPPVIIITTSTEPSRPAVERSPLQEWPASNGNGSEIGGRLHFGISDLEVVSLLVVVILELHNLVARDRRVQPNRSMQTRISRPRTLLPLTSRKSGIRRRKIRRRVAVAALDRWRESRTARAGEA